MPKQRKTARELADMIVAEIGVSGVQIAVFKSSVWDASIITTPAQAENARARSMLGPILIKLRTKYDLSESY
jgi:hypothetical protein